MREYQRERIKLVKDILPLFGDTFVLKGGTALFLYYGLDRYSEDIDLDAKTNNMNFINKLKHHKSFNEWNITIKKDTAHVFRAMLDYGSKLDKGSYPLKIEVSSRNKELLRDKTLSYRKIDKVNVYDISELINMKYIALTSRDKSRDFYDINFLLKKYPAKFDKDKLFGIKEKIFYFGEDEINLLLNEEIQTNGLINQTDYIDFAGNILNQISAIEKSNKQNKEIER